MSHTTIPAAGPADITHDSELGSVAQLAAQLRVDSIRCSTSAGSGHPSSSMSAADLLAVLVARHLHYDWDEPDNPANDHLIFSKGHASPLLYSIFKAAGVVSDEELVKGYRRFGERLEGHPTPELPWVDVATGSLGQGLPDGVGIALAGKYLDALDYRTWVLCGDSEFAEGSIWEALDKAGHYHLDNLVVILDVNRLGQRGETELGWDVDAYAARAESFGARAITIDGHDLTAIDEALGQARSAHDGRPVVIVAKTVKGAGYSAIADQPGWHGKALPTEMAEQAIAELGGVRDLRVRGPRPAAGEPHTEAAQDAAAPHWELGTKVATRRAYGDALAALSRRDPLVVALDAEVSNSTYAEQIEQVHPERFFEMYIAEQQLVGAATGLAVRGYKPYASTFAAFFTRAFDFIRMGAISHADLRLVGSHAGVEIGADGPSQMALEDLAMMRSVHASTVLYPSDASSTAALVQEMSTQPGISYLRTTRGAYPVLYGPAEQFPIGGSKVVSKHDDDTVTLVGAGVTLHESLKAAELLASEGIHARVLDMYSIKPLDVEGLRTALGATAGRLVVAEDHHREGGLGEAVIAALAGSAPLRLRHLAVEGMPGSGTGPELLAWAGIDAEHIAQAARELLSPQ
ncbi:transketolase [Propionibacterium cyclohexanicum]|uniref:Transketolase n=1 Tax=Propionibacterium cyclohexanicum TaxID=64702 RepID=A0A1H9Q3Q2_9ACTN|nr:transketolase [Propionibacterium cyclohexanicum]SER55206.1 transketolase [Propionibacterium cyclohexanicum]